MGDGVTLLDPLIAAARDKTLALGQDIADRAAAFAEPGVGLL
jgi:hypothetical protein